VEKTASFKPGSSVSFQCGRKCSQASTAPTNAPSNCAMKKAGTLEKSPELIATASVTAGLMCAPGEPQAMAVATPSITASPHPVAITIQPAPSAFDLLSTTLATLPLPSRHSTSVPMN